MVAHGKGSEVVRCGSFKSTCLSGRVHIDSVQPDLVSQEQACERGKCKPPAEADTREKEICQPSLQSVITNSANPAQCMP
jgi:hypothetical protein